MIRAKSIPGTWAETPVTYKSLLDIATLLGGVTAVWFLVEKIAPSLRQVMQRSRVSGPQSSVPPERRPVMWGCALTGVGLPLVGAFGRSEFVIFAGFGFAWVAMAGWKLAEDRSKRVELTFVYTGAFAMCWCLVAAVLLMVVSQNWPTFELFAVVAISLAGAYVGARFGKRITDYTR